MISTIIPIPMSRNAERPLKRDSSPALLSEHVEHVAVEFAAHAHFHHFLHLPELVKKLVDVLRLCAAPGGNSAPAASINKVRIMPFHGSHR